MHVHEFALFPTRLLAIEFPDTQQLNHDLEDLFRSRAEFREPFNMHPDSLNLLSLADTCPPIAHLRDMFLAGIRQWLAAERLAPGVEVEMVMFSNVARSGEFTLVHNHNAEVVGIYYVRTDRYDRPPLLILGPEGEYDYFAAEPGVLILHDPRFNANLAAVRGTDYARVYPRPGLMVVFPGYLWHSVTPHLGDFHRLALSVNCRLHWPDAIPAQRLPLFPPG